MKKNLKMFVTCGVLFAAASLMADTETVNGYTWTYSINGGTAEIYGTYDSWAHTPCASPSPTGTVRIPSSLGGKPVTSIGVYAFYGCSDMTSVTIPNSVTNIGEYVFSHCSSLTSMTIPDGVESIGNRAFVGCSSIQSYIVSTGNSYYRSENGLLLTKDGEVLVAGVNGEVIIPDSVTRIRDNAFFKCSGLPSVTIPDGVKSIGASAFYGCESMTNIVISPSVTNIADTAFVNCPIETLRFVSDGNALSLPVLNRDNFIFEGWFSDENDAIKLEVGSTVSSSKTYKPRWKKDGIVITSFDLTIPDEITVDDEYYNLFGRLGEEGVTLIGTIYDQEGVPIEIDNNEWSYEVQPAFYNASVYPPAGDCTIEIYATGAKVSGSATKTIKINKRNFNDDDSYWWRNYVTFRYMPTDGFYGDETSYGEGEGLSNGGDCGVKHLGMPGIASVQVGNYYDYVNGCARCPSISVYDECEGSSYHVCGEETYSIGTGEQDGNGYWTTSVLFNRSGNFRIVTWTESTWFEDEYSCGWIAGVEQTLHVQVAPRPIVELEISVESELVYTGEEIRNDGFEGNCLFDGKLRFNMSDQTSLYVGAPTAVTNAGVYQLAIGMDEYGYGPPTDEFVNTSEEWQWQHYVPRVVYRDPWSYYEYERDCYCIGYVGATNIAFTVLPRPVMASQARIVPRELHCDGTPQTCSFVITNDYNGAVLLEGRDYDVTYANNILAGTATATVACKGNYTGTFSQSFEILPSTNVVEVLGLDKKWIIGGNAEWFAEWFEAAHDGVSCMRSGAIGDNQESWIETVVTNTGVVSFWWKASSEAYRGIAYDKAVFSVDGVEVASIGGEVDWTNVTYNVEGNGPHALRWTYRKDDSDNGGQDCAWLDEVQYLREVRVTFEDGGATGGSVPAAMTIGEGLGITLPDQGSLTWPKHRFSGWRINDDILAPGTPYTLGYDDVLFTAAWEEKKVSAPTIEVAAWYDTERTAVTMGCETVGAVIHYTLDGSTPTAESPVCTGSFYLAGSATIKAIAVLDDYFDSDVVSAESVRAPWTPGECLNVPSFTFSIGGDATWFRDRTVTHDSDTAMRSGAIGDGQTSWIETSVSGAGTLTFWWKVSSEAYKGSIYDYARFTVDGDAAVPDIGGEIDWRCETVTITGSGVHTLRWAYVKDSQDKNGSDCAWLDEVTWTPVAMRDPIPPVVFDDEVAAALAGTTDASLVANVTNAAQYAAYRDWALSVTNGTTTALMIKESTRTWLSFAFGADALIGKELTSDDVKIESFTSASSDGKFEFTVSVKDVNIGGGSVAAETLKENLKKVLCIEGATMLSSGVFSSDNIDITFDAPVDGKARFTVTPPSDAGNSFFMRVKVK